MAVLAIGCESSQTLLSLSRSGKVRVHARSEGADAQIVSAKVTVTGVNIRSTGGAFYRFQLRAPQEIELVALSGSFISPMLAAGQVPDGLYDHFRLITEDTGSVTLTDGSTQVLKFPSGSTSGVKIFLNAPVTIANGVITKVEVFFDLSRSFVMTGAGFTNFKPVVRAAVSAYSDPEPDSDTEANPPNDDTTLIDDGSIEYPVVDGIGVGV